MNQKLIMYLTSFVGVFCLIGLGWGIIAHLWDLPFGIVYIAIISLIVSVLHTSHFFYKTKKKFDRDTYE